MVLKHWRKTSSSQCCQASPSETVICPGVFLSAIWQSSIIILRIPPSPHLDLLHLFWTCAPVFAPILFFIFFLHFTHAFHLDASPHFVILPLPLNFNTLFSNLNPLFLDICLIKLFESPLWPSFMLLSITPSSHLGSLHLCWTHQIFPYSVNQGAILNPFLLH